MSEDLYTTYDKNLYRIDENQSSFVDAERVGSGALYTFNKDDTLRASYFTAKDPNLGALFIITGNDIGEAGSIFIQANDATNKVASGSIFINAGDGFATTYTDGESIFINAGDGAGDGDGGSIAINAGDGSGTGIDGSITLNGGDITLTGDDILLRGSDTLASDITIQCGDGVGEDGGTLLLRTGDATTSNFNGGDVLIQLGAKSGSGTNGTIKIDNAGNIRSVLDFESITTSTKTFTFPNTSGTLVVTGGTDLTVPDGGTGVSSFTAYAVICGGTTSTGALQSIAGVGTSGQVLTSNGAGALPTFQNASGGGDLVKTCFASDFQVSGATVQYQTNDGDNVNVVKFANGSAQNALCSVKVPSGATSISSIKVYYQRKTTGNLYVVFKTSKIDNDSIAAITADNTDSLTTYASGGSDGSVESLTVPSAAYNGLGSIDADDIVSIDIRRDASSATDTYEADWQVIAVQFTFA